MDANPKSPWYQSNLGAAVAGGAVLLVLGFIVGPLIEPLNVALRALVIAGALVIGIAVFSVVSETWRRRIWIALWTWIRGLGVLTNKRRTRIRQEGIDARSAEVAEERSRNRQPQWSFDARDMRGEHNLFWLNNHGYGATDVKVTTNPDFFVLDGDVNFPGFSNAGPTGGYTGQWFKGYPTDKGKSEGVDFHVAWYDENGDPQERDVHMPASEIMSRSEETIKLARAEGFVEGREAGLAEAAVAARAPLPPPTPRWSLSVSKREGRDFTFKLENRIEGATAYNVRVDLSQNSSGLNITDQAFWPDFTGIVEGSFTGSANEYAAKHGFVLVLKWLTENHEGQSKTFAFRSWEDIDPWEEPAKPF